MHGLNELFFQIRNQLKILIYLFILTEVIFFVLLIYFGFQYFFWVFQFYYIIIKYLLKL